MKKRIRKVRVNGDVYIVKAVRTRFWKPGTDYIGEIIKSLSRIRVKSGDLVFISEKAISTAKGHIVDEEKVEAGLVAKLIARIWMRYAWGYLWGPASRLRKDTINFLRNYPLDYGARHKQVALQYAGFLRALCFGSEGGIDCSNLPYAYVCIPLPDADKESYEIKNAIAEKLGVKVGVILLDSDRCYRWWKFWISTRPVKFKEIKAFGGFATYLISNFLKLRDSPTPIAVAGVHFKMDRMYKLLKAVDEVRGYGAGRNVWEMAEKFQTSLTGVTWEMLEKIPHYPIVVARKVKNK